MPAVFRGILSLKHYVRMFDGVEKRGKVEGEESALMP
jgi:hypothetical protein